MAIAGPATMGRPRRFAFGRTCATPLLAIAAWTAVSGVIAGVAAPSPRAAGSASRGQLPAVTAYLTSPGLADPARVPQHGVFELTLAQAADYGGQANFADVTVTVTFTFEGATPRDLTVGGFYYGTPADGSSLWKARIAPPEPGRWRYHWSFVHTPSGGAATGAGTLEVYRSGPGFLRLSRSNAFGLLLDNGAITFPHGFNDCLGLRDAMQMDGGDRYGAFPGAVRADEYFAAYGQAGFEMFRFSQSNCSPNLADAALTSYDPHVAAYFDWLLSESRSHGFRIFYGLFGFLLPNNPADPPGPEVERFVRYSVDRWAAYVDVWELQNERSASDGWITTVAEWVRERDPYDHPITTSDAHPDLEPIEINAPHWYQYENELDSDRVTAGRANGWRSAGKPVIVGEQGNSVPAGEQFGNWLPDSARRMRLRSWTAYLHQISLLYWNNSWATNGSGGGASNLYLGPEERRYAHVLRRFADVVGRPGLRVPDAPVVREYDSSAMRAYGLASYSGVAAYLHHYADHQSPLAGQSITVDVPRAGTGVWIDPATGWTLATVPVVAGANRLAVPEFTIDLAFLAIPEAKPDIAPLALVEVHNPQADGDLDEDGQADRGPAEPPFGLPPLRLTLDGSGSHDPDGGELTWRWAFGDGSPDGAGPVVTHTYGDGSFLTTLTVTDDEGDVARHSLVVRATADASPDANDPPTLNALRDVTVWEGELVLVTPIGSDRELVDGSYHVDGHTTEAIEYRVEGLPPGAVFAAPNGQGQPQLWWVPGMDRSGVYEVELWAEDPDGQTSERRRVTITVRDAPEAGSGLLPGGRIYLPYLPSSSSGSGTTSSLVRASSSSARDS